MTQEGIGVEVDPGPALRGRHRARRRGGQVARPRWRSCAGGFARSGLSRSDVVVAVGGGVVTDLAGFAAASFHRGHGLRERGHLAAGPGRRGHRRQDRGQPARGQEPGRRLLAAVGRPVRHRTPRHAAAPGVGVGPGRDGQVRLPGRSTPTVGGPPAARPADRRAGGPVRGRQGGGGGLRRARGRPADAPQLRAHPGPRPRGVRLRRRRPPTCATARRWPSAWCSPPCWPGGSAGSTTPGWRSTAGGRGLRPRRRPAGRGATPSSCSAFMARDKKAQRRPDLRPRRTRRASRSVRGIDRADVVATLAEMESHPAAERQS